MATKRLIGILVGVVLAIGGILAASPVANAGTGTACSGTGCDGLDPTASFNASTGVECSTSASTVHSEPAFNGTLELRWGPNCTTNWTRFTPADNGTYEIWVTRLSDGVWAGTGKFNPYTFSGAAGVGHFSDQVYSPGAAAACVLSVSRNQEICYKQPA